MLSIPASTSVAAYDSTIPNYFCQGGRKIRVGDCALFQPAQDSPPFIGIIRELATRPEESIWLAVNWIYRPVDVKLGRGVLLEAAPNEVFFSFHKDEIPAASLLHPCKVAFLGKGVELPSGVSSYVCRRVYDIENKCLWWLTDKDYIKEQQEEVRKLLDKTRLEMDGELHSGGLSPKTLNVQTSHPQLKHGSDSIKNGNSSLSSQVKRKKRELGGPDFDLVKQERTSKTCDEDNGSENKLTFEIAKITQRGGLVDFEGVRKLVQLMHPEGAEMETDLVGRIMLADVISVTDSFECLGRFVQLKGLPLLDEWLQEVRKGKFGVGCSPKESNKSIDEFLLAVLRALDKLPVNLLSLQTSNVGKSVNYLRSHRNPEIQKKARSLVDTWKKRVKAEMNVIDAKSGLDCTVSSPSKIEPLDVSHVGFSRTGGSTEIALKSSIQQTSAPKSPAVNLMPGEAVAKLPTACTGGSNKLSSGTSLQRQSSPGAVGSATPGVQKESEKHQKVSSNRAKQQKVSDALLMDHGFNQRLIVRLPKTGCSPARCASEGSVEKPAVMCKTSPSPSHSESHKHHNKKARVKGISKRDTNVLKAEVCQGKDCVAVTDNVSPSAATPHDEQHSASENCEILKEASKAILTSESALETGKSFEASFSSINALIDSCVKFSEVSVSAPLGGDVGMNLLASVAVRETSKSDSSSPLRSGRSSPASEDPCSGGEAKLKQFDENVAHVQGQLIGGGMNQAIFEKSNSVDLIHLKNGLQLPSVSMAASFSGSRKAALPAIEKTGSESIAQIKPADNCCLVPEGNNGELTYDISVSLSSVLGLKEDECLNYKTNKGQLDGSDSLLDKDEKTNQSDDCIQKNCVVVEAASLNFKVELKNPVDNEQSFREQKQMESVDGSSKAELQLYSTVSLKTESLDEKAYTVKTVSLDEKVNTVKTESLDEKVNTVKTEVLIIRKEEKTNKDSVTITENNGDSSIFGSATHKVLKEVSVQANEPPLKTSGCKSDGVQSDGTDECRASSVNTSSSSTAWSEKSLKLDFDLNEGFPTDDESQGDRQNLQVPESSPAVHLSCPLSFPVSSMSSSFSTSITVTAAVKGPFVHPEHLSRIKGELGWKGSASTSAFRPAEPRKINELPLDSTATTSKHTRPPLDIDLNVSDVRVLDDVVSPHPAKSLRAELSSCNDSAGPVGGLDFDLNSVGDCPDTIQFAVSNRSKLEKNSLLSGSSLPGGFSNGEMSASRNFDLNGPGIDEVATETAPLRQNPRSNVPFLSHVPCMMMNHSELGKISSWLPPGNSYSTFTHPSFLPSSRGEQSYPVVSVAGPPRILVPSMNGTGASFGSEMFTGAVVSSSPALFFPPTSTFPYPGYPFETSLPMATNPYMNSSSGGAICFPANPPQLEGSTDYPRPYLAGLPGSTSSNDREFSQNFKWGNQSLDLNTGFGSTDSERRDERLPPALRQISVGSPAHANKQLHMYQIAGGGLKRKEPDGTWDISADRYKHP